MNVEQFIDSELKYFRPMLSQDRQCSPEAIATWRRETVSQRQKRISLEVYDLLNGTVKYGPFEGLKLNRQTWWGQMDLGAMCLGLYEKELLNFIDSLSPHQFSCFIDIGAADGYYACGLLLSRKVDKAICFEIDPKGRQVIEQNWEHNGSIGQLAVHGEATAHRILALQQADLNHALTLIDIEGGEFELLTEAVLESLKGSTIIIEIHNWVDDFEAKYIKLLMNAAQHFELKVIQPVDRPTAQFEELRHFHDDNRVLLASERRPCVMRFLVLTPKSADNSADERDL